MSTGEDIEYVEDTEQDTYVRLAEYADFKTLVVKELGMIQSYFEQINSKYETFSSNQQTSQELHLSRNDEQEIKIQKLTRENEVLKNELERVKHLEKEIDFLRQVDVHNKKVMKNMMEQETHHAETTPWTVPKKVAKIVDTRLKSNDSKVATRHNDIFSKNRYMPLSFGHNSTLVEKETSISESNIVPVEKQNTKPAVIKDTHRKTGFIADQKPENNTILSYRHTRTVPGNSTYSNITRNGKRILVVGDSMLRWVKGRKLTDGITNGVAFVKAFTGSTAKELTKYHIQPFLEKGGVDTAVIHVGTNSIPKQKYWIAGEPMETEEDAEEVAEGILELARECREKGINDIFINSIVHRQKYHDRKVNTVNALIERKCHENGFIYISNDFIDSSFLAADGLHFNPMGTLAYSSNLASYVNHYYENL